jgi:hypothetical protein
MTACCSGLIWIPPSTSNASHFGCEAAFHTRCTRSSRTAKSRLEGVSLASMAMTRVSLSSSTHSSIHKRMAARARATPTSVRYGLNARSQHCSHEARRRSRCVGVGTSLAERSKPKPQACQCGRVLSEVGETGSARSRVMIRLWHAQRSRVTVVSMERTALRVSAAEFASS